MGAARADLGADRAEAGCGVSDLARALTAERFGCNTWWTREPPPPPPTGDDDITCARRRRELEDALGSDDETRTA